MKYLTLILALFLAIGMYAQDTELLQASVKSKSKLIKANKSKGFELVGISARFGKGMENVSKVNEAITSVQQSGDTLLVEASLVANCCASFVAELDVLDQNTLNLIFEKNDIDCLCLKGIYLTYKIIAPIDDYQFQLNGNPVKLRKIDPNEEREEIEFWENGNMKSIKMYIGEVLHTEHLFDATGKRVKTISYRDGIKEEKTY